MCEAAQCCEEYVGVRIGDVINSRKTNCTTSCYKCLQLSINNHTWTWIWMEEFKVNLHEMGCEEIKWV